MTTEQWATELSASIAHTIEAHTEHAKKRSNSIRFWDKTTPYAIHPIWCAMTLLTETSLPAYIRQNGYLALLWHDILEDTDLPLPPDTPAAVEELVEEMTFESSREEMERIWQSRDVVKLLKLYDKVSNLLDATWMTGRKHSEYVEYTRRLTEFVLSTYGELNIVKIARAICAGGEG